MKETLAKKMVIMILIPFFIIFCVLSVLIFTMLSNFLTNWVQLEIKGITEVNAAEVAGDVDSVRISVMSASGILENINHEASYSRDRVDDIVRSMLANDSVYNAWLVYEPDAFDGRDSEHTGDYPGAPSGRFIRSYIKIDGEIVMAPDMDEDIIDDPEESPWYTRPRDSGRLYIDLNNEVENIWNYEVGEAPVYTLSIVMPIFRDNEVIGCIGADLVFDHMTINIGGEYDSTVAMFYSSGNVFYAPDMKYAEESIETLGFKNVERIRAAFSNVEPLHLSDEHCVFTDTQVFAAFQPVQIRYYDDACLFLFVATPRAALTERLVPIFFMIGATMFAVFAALVFFLVYVVRKVSKPINQLTLAADAISQGDIETEIGYYSEADGEIELLSQSLHRMVEQFRVHTMNMEQANKEMTIKSEIEALTTASGSMGETFEGIGTILCNYFQVFKTTIVFIDAGKPTAFFSVDPKQAYALREVQPQLYNYAHFEKVEALLADRKIVYLNGYSIMAQDIAFLEPQTKSACFIPLRKNALSGCLILENNGEKMLLSEGTESLMIYVAEILSKWLAQKEWKQDIPHEGYDLQRVEHDLQRVENDIHHVEQVILQAEQAMHGDMPGDGKTLLGVEHDILKIEQDILDVEQDILRVEQDILGAIPGEESAGLQEGVSGVIIKLKGIKGLNVESALEGIGGLQDVYIQTVKLTARLMPETIDKMDAHLVAGDMKKFAIEIHGIKGVMRNVGASELGSMAAKLESAALEGDKDYCGEEYPGYKECLRSFMLELYSVMETGAEKDPMDGNALKEALENARSAAEGYDAIQAADAVRPLLSYTHSGEVDGLLEKVVFALEEFNCQGALTYINEMEELLNA